MRVAAGDAAALARRHDAAAAALGAFGADAKRPVARADAAAGSLPRASSRTRIGTGVFWRRRRETTTRRGPLARRGSRGARATGPGGRISARRCRGAFGASPRRSTAEGEGERGVAAGRRRAADVRDDGVGARARARRRGLGSRGGGAGEGGGVERGKGGRGGGDAGEEGGSSGAAGVRFRRPRRGGSAEGGRRRWLRRIGGGEETPEEIVGGGEGRRRPRRGGTRARDEGEEEEEEQNRGRGRGPPGEAPVRNGEGHGAAHGWVFVTRARRA